MRISVLLLAVCATVAFAASPNDDETLVSVNKAMVVKSVGVEGGFAKVKLNTREGEMLDQELLRKDVKALWGTGEFEDIRVRTSEESDGVAVVFVVSLKAQLYLHDLRMEPNTFGMQPTLAPGTPIDPLRANQVALQIQKKLIERGYKDATVEPELKPFGKNKVDLMIHVKAGDSVKVEQVEVVGDTIFSQKEVAKSLQALRVKKVLPGIPGIWHGWTWHPSYSEAAVQSDLAHLQSFYLERGYFDAKVSIDDTSLDGDNAKVKLFVKAGQHYQVGKIAVSGEGVPTNFVMPTNGLFVARELCSCLMRLRREAEMKGVVDFTARLNLRGVEPAAAGQDPIADLAAQVDKGKEYTIGRIEFTGLKHYSEATVRRNFLLDETDLLDETKLRKSLARLNQSGLFEPVEESQVAVDTDEATATANIMIPLHEKKRGSWNFSGPMGPVSFAGPLQFMLASRLPPWGRGLLEASTWYLQFSLIGYAMPIGKVVPLAFAKQGIIPVFSLFRPFSPGEGWKSGLLIAPQLGWQGTVYSYATSQASSRLLPLIKGENQYQSQLSVTFERPTGDGVLLCDPPKPKYHMVRMGAAMVLQFLAAAPGM
jgi:outer membrane protein insertion porin family